MEYKHRAENEGVPCRRINTARNRATCALPTGSTFNTTVWKSIPGLESALLGQGSRRSHTKVLGKMGWTTLRTRVVSIPIEHLANPFAFSPWIRVIVDPPRIKRPGCCVQSIPLLCGSRLRIAFTPGRRIPSAVDYFSVLSRVRWMWPDSDW